MAEFAQILIKAKDQTKGAFDSASSNVRGLESAASKLNGMLSAVGVAGGLSAAGLAMLAMRGIDAADAMNDLSQRTGVSVKTLAGWKLAADQSGTSLDALGKGVQRLELSIGQAEQGSKAQAAALKNLGVTAKDPEQAFEQLADAVANSSDRTKTNADLQKVLGKSYAELLPLLSGGAQGLRDSATASATFAESMARMAPDADRFNDQMAALKTEAAGAAGQILAKLVPSLADTATRVRELLDEGQGIPALIRAFAGLGKLPWDVIFGDIKAADTAKARISELRAELGQLERNKASGNGLLMRKIFGEPEEIDRQILVIKNQIEALEKFGDKIYKPKPATAAAGASSAASFDTVAQPKQPNTSGGVDKLALEYDDLERAMKQAADESERLGESAAFEAMSLMETQNAVNAVSQEWVEAGRALTIEMMTPLEKVAIETERIQTMLDKGLITQETADRAGAALEASLIPKLEKTKSLGEEIGLTFTSAFEDAIVKGGDFSDVLAGIEEDLLRLATRKLVTEPLMSAFAGFLPFADGGAIGGGALSAYSNSIVTKPTVFPFATGGVPNLGIMGEQPGSPGEAILPLKRGPGGVLGVQAAGNVQVIVNNNASGTQATATESMEGNTRIIEVVIEQARSLFAGDIATGGSKISSALERTYALNRSAGSY